MTTPTYAVGLRFSCAALFLFVWLAIWGEPLRLTLNLHAWTAASGTVAYGISYVLTYIAEQSVPSDPVAIAFTLMVFLTPALKRVA